MHYPCNNALSLCTGCALFASFPPQIHSPTSLTLVGFSLVLWLPDGLAKGRPQQEIPKGRRVDISSCSLPASALGASSFQVTPLYSPQFYHLVFPLLPLVSPALHRLTTSS